MKRTGNRRRPFAPACVCAQGDACKQCKIRHETMGCDSGQCPACVKDREAARREKLKEQK